MHRFFCPNADFNSPLINLTQPEEIHHLKNVLRLTTNDTVIIFDGKGRETSGTILTVEKQCVRIQINGTSDEPKKALRLSLACAIPKNAKFEMIIEKCTELGVDEIIPLQTHRTEVIVPQAKALSKLTRYQTVAINAAKQSKRKTIPKIYPITTFKDALRLVESPQTLALIPCLTDPRENLKDVLQKSLFDQPSQIIFLIGPEGDFTPQEIRDAVSAKCIPVSLGERVLKVDTAAISVVAIAANILKL